MDSSYSDIFALKIHQDKIRINNKKVTDIIKDLLEKYAEYLTEYDLVNNQATSETEDGVIWILQDKGIEYSGNKIYPTSKRLLICYHQFFKNANPMHFFDENKPAWNAPITIPHTLLASMVNITRPFNNANIIKIHDPFCGSGSLILEMLKDDHVFATGGDNSKIANFLLKHNLEFFSLTADDIRTLKNNFKTVAESIKNNSHEDAKKKYDVKALKNINYKEGFEKAHNLLIDLINFEKNPEKDPSSYTYSEDFEKRINNYSNLERLIFYVALRAHVKRCAIQTETWSDSFHDEALNLINSLEKFIYWKQLEFANSARPKIQSSSVNLGMTLNDAFGFLNLALNYRLYQTAFEEKYFEREQEADATEDNPEFDQYYDIVVTDPPYGFNTNENVYELSNLYANFIKVWIKKIKPKGHLVICLPSETYNGQVLPFCTMPELVTAQVLAAVAAENKIIISPAKMQPSLSPGMQPPYFWVSTKVLRRSILHFQIDTLN